MNTIRERLTKYKESWHITDQGMHTFFMSIPGDFALFFAHTDEELEEMYARHNLEKED